MSKLGAWLVVLAGLLCLGLAGAVAIRGGEPPIPSGAGVLEGTLEPGPVVPTPVGEPVLFGEVQLTDLRSDSERTRRRYWAETVGDASVEVATAAGPRPVRLEPPDRWYTLPGDVEETQVSSLAGLPVVGGVNVAGRLSPPYVVRVIAVRPGDPVLVGADGRVYLGRRAALEAERQRREDTRWPVVGMLAVIGLISVLGGGGSLRRRPAGGA